MTDRPDWLRENWVYCENLGGAPYVLTEDNVKLTMRQAEQIAQEEDYVEQLPAIVPQQQVSSWLDMDAGALKATLARRTDTRRQLLGWISDSLKEGTDYGCIHFVKKDTCNAGASCTNPGHFSKPSLWKAGAEKIAGMLGWRAAFPDLDGVVADLRQGGTVIVMFCQLVTHEGFVVSEGVGARNLEQDYGVANKALKMAKKSALIDAVLNAAGLSEVFTQDLADDDAPGQHVAATLDEDGGRFLKTHAIELYGDKAEATLASLARRRFHISDGDYTQIPAYRLQDALRSLDDKAADGFGEGGEDEGGEDEAAADRT